jgi:hypothetical protein
MKKQNSNHFHYQNCGMRSSGCKYRVDKTLGVSKGLNFLDILSSPLELKNTLEISIGCTHHHDDH